MVKGTPDIRSRQQSHPEIFAAGGEMGRLMAAIDWSATPIGSLDQWPQSLLTAVSICLSSRFPILLWWGPELVMIYNDAYRPMLGTTKHPKAMGQAGRECWPEIWHVIGPMLEGVMSRGEATWSEDQLLLLDRNGYVEECYFTFSYSPISYEAGSIGGVFTAVTETTERVYSERRLSCLSALAEHTAPANTAEEACTRAIETLQNHPDVPFSALYLLNEDGTHAGIAACYPSGLQLPNMVDVRGEDEGVHGALARAVKTGQLMETEAAGLAPATCRSKNGLVPLRAMLLPVYTTDRGRIAALLVAGINSGCALDQAYRGFLQLIAGHAGIAIAHARTLEEERRRAQALAELNQTKTAFFSNISHEFRTPLTLLLGPLEDVLGAAALPAPHREHLEIVRRNALRLLKLINALLDFSRLEAGRLQAVYRPVDFAALTADLASLFRSAMSRAGLRFIVDCPPLSQPVYLDSDLWEKVVFNLLSNALKFTFEGEVAVRLREEAGVARLDISDTGIGIPPQELPRLFERFYRVRGAKARTHEGAGIGLSLVGELVRLHGGDVVVESEVDRGTRFTLTIPLGREHLPADKIGRESPHAPASTCVTPFLEEARPEVPAPASLPDVTARRPSTWRDKDLRVLVVDDNADMREYIRRVLDPCWTVETVGDGEAALALVRRNPPDLVLSDVMMPLLDGFGLLRVLKSDARTSDIPFIMLSARAGEEASVEGLQAGADDYLAKPFPALELVARVRIALARRQAERRLAFHAYLLDMIGEAVIATDLTGRILYWNHFAENLFGWRADEAMGKNIMTEFMAGQTPKMAEISQRVLQGESWSGEIQAYHRDGRAFTAALTLSPFVDSQGRPIGEVAVATDITARKKMEEDLSRIQKLDSIGVLAGGIAHDFNNILTALFGNIALARLTTNDDRANSALGDAEKAFWRARSLTNQLLTFAKGGAPICRVGRLEPLLREAPLLAITGSNIKCRLAVPRDLWLVNFDPGQISQTLHNLVINAKEAMPEGGSITIAADNVVVQQGEVGELPPGRYVRVVVADGGQGIAPEHLPKIFDPYFSTKPTGSGLGLAITYSIVKKHGGHIEAESKPHHGATFRMYLPASDNSSEVSELAAAPVRKGAGRVLLMDDDEGVRRVGGALLTRLGYQVALAKEGAEALALYQRALAAGKPFMHVILDLTVRDGMGGKECLQKLRAIDPDARVLVSSGYSNDPVMADHRRHGFDGVIKKPYRPEELSEALHVAKLKPGGGV